MVAGGAATDWSSSTDAESSTVTGYGHPTIVTSVNDSTVAVLNSMAEKTTVSDIGTLTDHGTGTFDTTQVDTDVVTLGGNAAIASGSSSATVNQSVQGMTESETDAPRRSMQRAARSLMAGKRERHVFEQQ